MSLYVEPHKVSNSQHFSGTGRTLFPFVPMKSSHARLRAKSSARAAGPSKLALPIGSASNAPAIVGRLIAVGHKNMEDLRRAQNSLPASGLGTALGTNGNIYIHDVLTQGLAIKFYQYVGM